MDGGWISKWSVVVSTACVRKDKKNIKWVFCKNPKGRRHESGVVEFGGEG